MSMTDEPLSVTSFFLLDNPHLLYLLGLLFRRTNHQDRIDIDSQLQVLACFLTHWQRQEKSCQNSEDDFGKTAGKERRNDADLRLRLLTLITS